MPYLLSEWRGRIQQAAGEYRVTREACNRLKIQAVAYPSTIHSSISEHLEAADLNLEGTYIVRIFAVFDAALRSYDRSHFQDQERETRVAVMIDQLGGLLKVPPTIREGVHKVRRLRHFWAHELEIDPGPMAFDRVRGYLHSYLDRFPKIWD